MIQATPHGNHTENFKKDRNSFGDLEYMRHAQAELLRDLIIKHDARDTARNRKPNIEQVLSTLDLPWTIEVAMQNRTEVPTHWRAVDSEECSTPAIRLVFDTLVPHLNYTDRHIINDGQWGIARKPLNEPEDTA